MRNLMPATILLFLSLSSFSQDNDKHVGFFFIPEVGFETFSWHSYSSSGSTPDLKTGANYMLSASAGFFVTPNFSLGGNLLNVGFNSPVPIIVAVGGEGRYFLKDNKNTPFLLAGLGYDVYRGNHVPEDGYVRWTAGGGYEFKAGKVQLIPAARLYNRNIGEAGAYTKVKVGGVLASMGIIGF